MSREIAFEGTNLVDARAKAASSLTTDELIIQEVVTSKGGPKTVLGTGATVANAEAKARSGLGRQDRVLATRTEREPTERTLTVSAPDDAAAKSHVDLKSGESCTTRRADAGSRGFLGLGRRLLTYELAIRTSAEVAVDVESIASIRCRIGTLEDKYDAEYATMPSRERVRILREGAPREQDAMLRAVAQHGADDAVEFAAIDLLGCGAPALQSSALQLLIKREWIPATAWRIAFELRGRDMYVWELLNSANIMSKLADTPPLGVERARGALEFVRRELVQEAPRAGFEERFHTFTLKDEPLVAAGEATRRLADKSLCRGCGARMARRPDLVHIHGYVPDPPVALRCDTCDITRFEKSSEVA